MQKADGIVNRRQIEVRLHSHRESGAVSRRARARTREQEQRGLRRVTACGEDGGGDEEGVEGKNSDKQRLLPDRGSRRERSAVTLR